MEIFDGDKHNLFARPSIVVSTYIGTYIPGWSDEFVKKWRYDATSNEIISNAKIPNKKSRNQKFWKNTKQKNAKMKKSQKNHRNLEIKKI
jgi:hypothetical protein